MPLLRLLRVANPAVRALLRSPAHRLLSGSLAVLEYEGRSTGMRHAIPVVYADDGTRVVALAAHPERKQWWRTFRQSAPATLVVRGERRAVQGRLLAGAERRAALRSYLAARPRTAGPLRARGAPTDGAHDAVPAAVVAFEPLRTEPPARSGSCGRLPGVPAPAILRSCACTATSHRGSTC